MHEVYVTSYEENVNKKEVQEFWDNKAKYADYQEGCSGLLNDIRWINTICENKQQAQEFIEKNDKGWYDQLAVKYYDYPSLEKTKKYEDLEKRINDWTKKLGLLSSNIHYSNVKSKFISCPNCDSKLNTSFIKWNVCPICKNDMRPKTILDTIKRYKEIISNLNNELKEEELKIQKRIKNKASIKWLVKIEYHV